MGDNGAFEFNEVGDYLAGALTPLALFWVILGYRQQGKELRNNTAQLELQAEELKNSTDQLKLQTEEIRQSVEVQTRQAASVEANTVHAYRDVFLRMSDLLLNRLYNDVLDIADLLYERGLNEGYEESYRTSLEDFRNGYPDSMIYRVLSSDYSYHITASPPKLYFDMAKNRFCKTFELLIEEAIKMDHAMESSDQISFVELYNSMPLKALYDKLVQTKDLDAKK